MTNRVTLIGKVLDAPKIRSIEARGGPLEIVSLWIEVRDDDRADRFTIEIHCPKAAATAKAMQVGVLVEATGVLRHDRWKDKQSAKWLGKVFVAIDPGAGALKSKGIAPEQPATKAEAA